MAQKDRLSKLLDPQNTVLNGIDFVEIASQDQTVLRVHFLNGVEFAGSPPAPVMPAITGGERIPVVRVLPLAPDAWSHDAEGRPLLTLQVAAPGDFSFYTLTLSSPGLDPFYNHVVFSFKALCPSDLDCEAAAAACPPFAGDPPPIDYLAKDFLSFRKALSDFSSLRYPAWQERSEADFGVVFMEALSSLGDDLSYTQDRIAAEAVLDTATQRRSLVRLARLVDYEPTPATSSTVLLQLEAATTTIPSGMRVSASRPDGSQIVFETGAGLIDPVTLLANVTTYTVSPAWNRYLADGVTPNIVPYIWDDSWQCLAAGQVEMWVIGQGFHFFPGQNLLLDTAALTTADPPTREMVTLTSVDEEIDPLYDVAITHLVWSGGLAYNHDLTRTVLAGNLVPATQGQRYSESFMTGETSALPPVQMSSAIVRTGPNRTLQYLYTLRQDPLVWLGEDPLPEILLTEQPQQQGVSRIVWNWRDSLLNAEQFERAYTLDPVRYLRLNPNSDSSVSYEYDGDGGATIRFGDDLFGETPETGSLFQVTYRVGGGSDGNVAPDTITKLDPNAAGLITAATNPFAATGGADEEPAQQVQRLAPQQFRAIQYRAVQPQDYEQAAETLPWVERAGTTFRWTGSWLTVFTTADPKGTEQTPIDESIQLINLLNRYRLAGYESYAPLPFYISVDLQITVCACSGAAPGDAEAAVIAALGTTTFPDGTSGFFAFDRFTFGTPLERSALEAAIQNSYGVCGVVSILYRWRGLTSGWICLPQTLQVGPSQILRVDNDPNYPERGTLKVFVEVGQ
jgi:uncharacterized phage protein gp47/JayE